MSIATVLAMCPNVLVLDEPSSNLDPRARRRLTELLGGRKHAKLVATHDLDLALDLCERTIVMADGRAGADGPTREIFTDDALLARSGLERPLAMQGCPVCAIAASNNSGLRTAHAPMHGRHWSKKQFQRTAPRLPLNSMPSGRAKGVAQ